MNNSPSIKIKVKPDVLLEELENEAVLLCITNEHYFGLDEVGLKFWTLLDEHKNSNLVVQALLVEYDIDENTAKQDLESFIKKLEQANLVEIVND